MSTAWPAAVSLSSRCALFYESGHRVWSIPDMLIHPPPPREDGVEATRFTYKLTLSPLALCLNNRPPVICSGGHLKTNFNTWNTCFLPEKQRGKADCCLAALSCCWLQPETLLLLTRPYFCCGQLSGQDSHMFVLLVYLLLSVGLSELHSMAWLLWRASELFKGSSRMSTGSISTSTSQFGNLGR